MFFFILACIVFPNIIWTLQDIVIIVLFSWHLFDYTLYLHFLVVFISLWIVMFLSESIFLPPEELCLLFSLSTGLLVINLLGHCLIREVFIYFLFWRMFSQGISRFVFTSFHHLKDVFHCLLVSSVSGKNCWLYESNLTFCSGCF